MINEIIKRAIPIALSRVLVIFLSMVDLIFLGQLALDHAGAYAVGAQIIQIFVVFASSVFIGLYVIAPKRDPAELESDLSSLSFLSLSMGFLSLLACLSISRYFFTDAPLISQVIDILAYGLPPLFVIAALSSDLEARRKEKLVLYYSVAANLINVALNFVFIRIFDSVISAVAWSTTVSRFIECMALILYFAWIEKRRFAKIDRPYLKTILLLGAPEGFSRILFVSGLSLVLGLYSKTLPPIELSAVGFMLNFMNMQFILVMSAAIAMTVVFQESKREKMISLFVRYSLLLNVLLFLVSLSTAPLYSFIYTSAISWPLIVVFGLAAVTILFDGLTIHFISLLRINELATWPPYVRLLLIPCLIAGCYFFAPVTAEAIGVHFLIGGFVAFSGVLMFLLQLVRNAKHEARPTSV